MQRLIFLFLLSVFSGVLSALPLRDSRINAQALAVLTSSLGIPENADIIAETQKRWLRKAGERWEMAELSDEQKQTVLDWATEQGMFSSEKPCRSSYDKALILGATTSRMKKRLNYLKELWEEGVRFREIVWLTGDRPLDSRVDDFLDRIDNESQAAHLLWEETDLPEEMRNLPVVFIAAPMKREGDTLKRPNTEDTLIAWLEKKPGPHTALFISDQPFCGYQFAVIDTCLPDYISFDVAGKGTEGTPSAAVTLDSLARRIYQESLRSKKKGF